MGVSKATGYPLECCCTTRTYPFNSQFSLVSYFNRTRQVDLAVVIVFFSTDDEAVGMLTKKYLHRF